MSDRPLPRWGERARWTYRVLGSVFVGFLVTSWALRWSGVFSVGAWLEEAADREDPAFLVFLVGWAFVFVGTIVSGVLHAVAQRRASRRTV